MAWARGAAVVLATTVWGLVVLANPPDVGSTVGLAAATAVVLWALGRLRPLFRGLLEVLVGTAGLLVGAGIGVWHVVRSGLTPDAVVGLVALAVGVVLLGLGVRHVFAEVPKWWRLTAIPVAFLLFQFILVPVTPTVAAVDPPRAALGTDTPASYSLIYLDVDVVTADNVHLSGWYVPSRNGAAVVVLHGSGSSRSGVLPQAAALASRGYGALLYDDRGQGVSEGTGMDFGWWGDLDLRAGLDWLQKRPEVGTGRLGVVGISMGGEQSLNLAATDGRVRVVVAEGVQARQPVDLVPEPGIHGWTVGTVLGLSTTTAAVLSAAPEPMPLAEAARRIAPRPVLLVAGAGEEAVVRRVQAVAPQSTEVWPLPNSAHAQGFADQPQQWSSRVGEFLDAALTPHG